MKIILGIAFSSMVVFCSCSAGREIRDNKTSAGLSDNNRIENYWLDGETGTVHKVIHENGSGKIVSSIKYNKGVVLEEMKVVIADNINGRMHWIYFVPTTGYEVELTEISSANDRMDVSWRNRYAGGAGDSGVDILHKCDEHGFIFEDKRIIFEDKRIISEDKRIIEDKSEDKTEWGTGGDIFLPSGD